MTLNILAGKITQRKMAEKTTPTVKKQRNGLERKVKTEMKKMLGEASKSVCQAMSRASLGRQLTCLAKTVRQLDAKYTQHTIICVTLTKVSGRTVWGDSNFGGRISSHPLPAVGTLEHRCRKDRCTVVMLGPVDLEHNAHTIYSC